MHQYSSIPSDIKSTKNRGWSVVLLTDAEKINKPKNLIKKKITAYRHIPVSKNTLDNLSVSFHHFISNFTRLKWLKC